MVRFRTNKVKGIRDNRGNIIGQFIIKLVVNKIEVDANGIKPSGFYFYNDGEKDIFLDCIKTQSLSYEVIEQIETQLPNFSNSNIKEAFLQRVMEFTLMQLQLENGQNYGIQFEEWEQDV